MPIHSVRGEHHGQQVRSKKVVAKRAVKPAVAADNARNVWLAGLGAVAIARKQGLATFETRQRRPARAGGRREDRARSAGCRAGGSRACSAAQAGRRPAPADRGTHRERYGRALSWLGVPSKSDVDALVKRIDAVEAAARTASRRCPRPLRSADEAILRRQCAQDRLDVFIDGFERAASPRRSRYSRLLPLGPCAVAMSAAIAGTGAGPSHAALPASRHRPGHPPFRRRGSGSAGRGAGSRSFRDGRGGRTRSA